DLTALPFRKLSKYERAIVQQVGVAGPMLFIVVSFGQKPELVSAIVEPLAGTRGKILAGKLRIYEQVRVSGKSHLHQPPSILRHDNQLRPPVRELLCVPPLIVDGFHATVSVLQICLTECRKAAKRHQEGEC